MRMGNSLQLIWPREKKNIDISIQTELQRDEGEENESQRVENTKERKIKLNVLEDSSIHPS